MKTLLATPLVCLALMLPAVAQPATPSLMANGEGTESAAPDIAIVTLGVLSRADDARAALDANNSQIDAVIQAVRAESIADKDVQTIGFSIFPVYSQEQPRPNGEPVEPRVVGYQVSNQIRVVVRDLEKTGALLDKAVTAGANQATSISFDIEDRRELVEKATRAAIEDAKAKAELMAEAAGVRLVRILSVNANEGGGAVPQFDRVMAASAKAVPVMGGELTVSANAQISWEIAPK